MTTAMTTSATQNNRLFSVEFTQGLQTAGLDLLKSQDYHGLRGVHNPKALVNRVAGHPDNPIRIVDDQRHGVAPLARDLPVHEEILQLLAAAEPEGPKPVARATEPDAERPMYAVQSDDGHVAGNGVSHGCIQQWCGGSHFSRNHPGGFSDPDLTRNRQRIPQKVRPSLSRGLTVRPPGWSTG